MEFGNCCVLCPAVMVRQGEGETMNPLHLLWIVPVSASVGAFLMAILKGGDCEPDCCDEVET